MKGKNKSPYNNKLGPKNNIIFKQHTWCKNYKHDQFLAACYSN